MIASGIGAARAFGALGIAAALGGCGAGDPPTPPVPRIEWTADVQAGLARAKAEGRPVLLALVSGASPGCRELESGPFASLSVIEAARPFVAVRVDVDADKASARAFRVSVIPDVRFLDADGRELGRLMNRRAGEPWSDAAVTEQLRARAAVAAGVPGGGRSP
jgi:hypothetical protein